MSFKKNFDLYSPKIERVLIILIFATVLMFYIFSGESFVLLLLDGIIILELALILLYMLEIEKKLYLILWAVFICGIVSIYVEDKISDRLYYILNGLGFLIFGLIVLLKGIKASLKNKNFELLTFIMGFLLVLGFPLPYFTTQEEVFIFYNFAICGAIGMTIYNDNLWHRYTSDEKNFIKFILIVFLVMVIQTSFEKVNL